MSNDSFDFVGFIAWFENLIDYIIAIISGKRALDFDNLEKLNIMDCIECGICSYTCQCRNPITQNIKIAKAKLRERNTKK